MSDGGEQTRRRRRPAQPPAQPAQGSVARGVALVVVAVVIGLLLLRDDDSGSTQVAVGAEGSTEVDEGTEEGSDEEVTSTTSTTQALRPPSEVKVLVANGSSVNGAAGTATDALEALGYVTGTPANTEAVTATVIYFTEGYEAEAEALAEAIGAPATAVTAMPPVAPVDDLQLANLLVIIGPDLAGG